MDEDPKTLITPDKVYRIVVENENGHVRFIVDGQQLVVEVVDRGQGFDPAAADEGAAGEERTWSGAVGTRLAFAAGYNDRDGGEEAAEQLRWIDQSTPWAHAAAGGTGPRSWGDIEIGPMIGPSIGR